jgi:hypothetical protein
MMAATYRSIFLLDTNFGLTGAPVVALFRFLSWP